MTIGSLVWAVPVSKRVESYKKAHHDKWSYMHIWYDIIYDTQHVVYMHLSTRVPETFRNQIRASLLRCMMQSIVPNCFSFGSLWCLYGDDILLHFIFSCIIIIYYTITWPLQLLYYRATAIPMYLMECVQIFMGLQYHVWGFEILTKKFWNSNRLSTTSWALALSIPSADLAMQAYSPLSVVDRLAMVSSWPLSSLVMRIALLHSIGLLSFFQVIDGKEWLAVPTSTKHRRETVDPARARWWLGP